MEFARQDRINAHQSLKDDFVSRVLGLEWAFISDESSLRDFHTEPSNDALCSKIRQTYGVDVGDIESGNLADILERIARSR